MTSKGDFFFEGHRSIRYIQNHIVINMMLTDSFDQQKVEYHKPFVTLGRHVEAEITFFKEHISTKNKIQCERCAKILMFAFCALYMFKEKC